MASPPAAVMSRTVSSPSAPWTSATTTLAPSRAKICAVARPMPELPPVTKATFPATRPAIVFLLVERRSCRCLHCLHNEDAAEDLALFERSHRRVHVIERIGAR